ncbi:hypothetical protein [Chitinophaga sp.]|uniref:hypothetical protein n=1 Tax=Chitinophaga sp. TaxID=1869181 RepID=UPI002F935E50
MDAGMDADEMSNYAKVEHAFHQRMRNKETVLVREIIAYGMAQKEIRPLKVKEQELLTFLLLTSLHGLKTEMVINNSFSQTEAAVKALAGLTIHGLKG